MGLNDTAWQALFEKYDILDEIQRSGQFVISANQIKEFREPRLMTKFDHKVNLPTVFADNGLYEAYDDMVLIKQALIERDRKIYGLQQHNRNLEDKLERICGYHYGNPKQ